MRKILKQAMVVALMATLIAGMIPAAAESFQAVVTSKQMKVYSQASPHTVLGKLSRGTAVTVKAYSGNVALISYNGNSGMARVGDMRAVSSEKTEEKPETASAQETADARTVVTTRAAKVYKRASTRSGYVKVKAGTTLKLLATRGNVARVQRGGTVGYMDARLLGDPDQAQETRTDTDTAEQTVERYDRKAVVATKDTRIYSQPNTSSESTSVEKGSRMVLLAVKGAVAMVEREGKVGYIAKSSLAADTSPAESAVQTAVGDATAENLTGSNEEIVFKFLTKVMGYNTAAACGVMANIKYESGYRPTAGGDRGTSYGIVQWHAGRKTRLINWCNSNGHDYKTLTGQLYYLQYELKNRYPAVHKRLKAVENTEQGAYDAGYDFCYNFEAPSSRASRSVTRGNYARNTLWNRYRT